MVFKMQLRTKVKELVKRLLVDLGKRPYSERGMIIVDGNMPR